MGDQPHRARVMWEAVERFHATCYTAPEVRETATEIGLKGFWMNYFATRAAPLGPVPPEVVQSLFFYYGPARVHRALPDAWGLATPDEVLAARYRGMDLALRRLLGDSVVGDPAVAEAASLTRTAAAAVEPRGRVLFAGWSALPWPDEPHLALWHGCTLLREARSGSHLSALVAEGYDGCESVVTHVAAGGAPAVWIDDEARWSDDDVAAARARLRGRGLLADVDTLTDVGLASRRRVEDRTDALDDAQWRELGEGAGRRLVELLAPYNARFEPDDQLDWRRVYA